MKRALMCVLVSACEDTGSVPDPTCQVDLSGYVVESVSSAGSCPVLTSGLGATQGDTLLQFRVTSKQLGSDLTIGLDLGQAPGPGSYASRTTVLWSASAMKTIPPGGACLLLAGNNATPSGYFELTLEALEQGAAHGELSLTMYVLPRTSDDGTQTDCGPGSTEDAQIRF